MKINKQDLIDHRVTSNIVRGYTSKDPVDKNMADKALDNKREQSHKAGKDLEDYQKNPVPVEKKPKAGTDSDKYIPLRGGKTTRSKGALGRI